MASIPCPNCGRPVEADTPICPTCGRHWPGRTPNAAPGAIGAESVGASRPHVKNWLVEAIIATACCCLPFGVASLVFAAQVNGKLDAGDVAGAQRAADRARFWFFVSIGGWVLAMVAYVGLLVLGGAMGALSDPMMYE